MLIRILVAPHAGAWIEMDQSKREHMRTKVAPHAGAWIEIKQISGTVAIVWSHPMRVRGLK